MGFKCILDLVPPKVLGIPAGAPGSSVPARPGRGARTFAPFRKVLECSSVFAPRVRFCFCNHNRLDSIVSPRKGFLGEKMAGPEGQGGAAVHGFVVFFSLDRSLDF